MNETTHYGSYYMTICLAGVYENGKGVVMVADKAVTYDVAPEGTRITVDHDEINKIGIINKAAAVMGAGTKTYVQKLVKELKNKWPPESDEEACLKYLTETYKEVFRYFAFWNKLLPLLRFKNIEEYTTAELNDKERMRYELMLQQFAYNFDLSVLLVAKAKGGYRVYEHNQGAADLREQGFGIIGSGKLQAIQTVAETYRPSMTRSEVRDLLLKAKKEAEVLPYIGKKTDVQYLE